jgi:hypothetical protein
VTILRDEFVRVLPDTPTGLPSPLPHWALTHDNVAICFSLDQAAEVFFSLCDLSLWEPHVRFLCIDVPRAEWVTCLADAHLFFGKEQAK